MATSQSTPISGPSPDPRLVAILRLAFLLGAGVFGGVIGFLRSGASVSRDVETTRALTVAGRGVWIVALAACLLLAARVRGERAPRKVFSQSVIGWAIAESTAIFGGVYWYLLGASNWYFSGLGFLALSLIMLPGIRRPV